MAQTVEARAARRAPPRHIKSSRAAGSSGATVATAIPAEIAEAENPTPSCQSTAPSQGPSAMGSSVTKADNAARGSTMRARAQRAKDTYTTYIDPATGWTWTYAATDGACSGNPGPGGWGVLMQAKDGQTVLKQRDLKGGEAMTTNNRMELLAAINALETLDRPSKITIFTDSTYVKNGITQWMHGWKRNGWRTANKKPVKNVDLWQRLEQATERHDVTWEWNKEFTSPWRRNDLPEVGTTVSVAPRLCSKSTAVMDATVVFNSIEPRVRAF